MSAIEFSSNEAHSPGRTEFMEADEGAGTRSHKRAEEIVKLVGAEAKDSMWKKTSSELTKTPVPDRPLFAILVSIIIGTACAGIMFVYNVPGALSTGLEEEYGFSSADVSMLAAAYTGPSALTAILAAEALAKFGLVPVCFMCAACVHLGSFGFAIAPYMASQPFALMLVAQMINGAGDPLGLACSPAMVARWFRHNHMGLSMGVTLMVTQLVGAMLPFEMLPAVHSSLGLNWAFWVSTLIQLAPLLCLVIYWLLDRRCKAYLKIVDAFDDTDEPDVDGAPSKDPQKRKGSLFIQRLKAIPVDAWLQITAVCVIPVTQYVSLGLLPIYLHSVHGMSEMESGDNTSFVWWFCITAPFWGMLSDSPRVGRLHMQLVGTIIAMICFLIIAAGLSNKILLAALGSSFAILDQNSYVCVEAFVTDRHLTDFVYGVMGALFNVGMGVITYLAGQVAVKHMPLVYFGSLSTGAILTCILLMRLEPDDAAKKGLLPQRHTAARPDNVSPEAQSIGASDERSLA